METWRPEDLETWRHGELETSRVGDLETLRGGELETWRLGELESWRPGVRESWRVGELESMRPGELETLSKDSLARIPQPGIFKKSVWGHCWNLSNPFCQKCRQGLDSYEKSSWPHFMHFCPWTGQIFACWIFNICLFSFVGCLFPISF